MTEINSLGEINLHILQEEFGKLMTNEIIVTDERISHIMEHHPEDYELFKKYALSAV